MSYDYRYLKIDDGIAQKVSLFNKLEELFTHLVLQQGGDAQAAFDTMKKLQTWGYIDKNVDLNEFLKELEKKNIVEIVRGQASLTSKGERKIRQDSLMSIFSNLRKGAQGGHATNFVGEKGDNLPELRPWTYGDDTSQIDFQSSLKNALKRGQGKISLQEEDLEVCESEQSTNCATMLLIDISHSMILYGEDRMTPAKRVAIALTELIRRRFPKDSIDIALFGDDAFLVKPDKLLKISCGPYHTNTRAGLLLAQKVLSRRKYANKQIFMITDGKPSVINEKGGLYKNSVGLDPKIVNKTLEAAASCRRSNITITTFMVTSDPYLVQFVEKLTEVNKARAFFTSSEDLGQSIFVDYIRNRRRKLSG
jgi:Ca-activated chloride channel family protein